MNPRHPRPARHGLGRALVALACAAGTLLAARAAEGADSTATAKGAAAGAGATTTPRAATAPARTPAPAPAALAATKPAAAPAAHATRATARSTTAARNRAKPGPEIQAPAATATAGDSAGEGGYRLKGGQEGTAFRSLTIEGEDRIHFEFDRPELAVSLDPSTAPGLEWGSARDVLDRTVPDAMSPLLQASGREPMPYLAHPWLAGFATGAVARFHPDVEGVDRWKLTVADAHGQAIRTFSGRGAPPRDMAWDGRSADGSPVTPGLTYSYVFEAYDKAGNKRNIVGKGFSVGAYKIDTPDGPVLSFCGDSLWTAAAGPEEAHPGPARTPDLLLEAASWMNQSGRPGQPVKVTATARSRDQAEALAGQVVSGLAPLLPGGATRLKSTAVVQPDCPGGGTVTIAPAR